MFQCPICATDCADGIDQCPACGFRFSGATQGLKRLVDEQQVQAPKVLPKKTQLRVVKGSGPQIHSAFQLTSFPAVIGRNPNCEVFLNDMTVSRKHAIIMKTENGYRIADQASFNGTWVNNVSVESAKLNSGDVIQVGVFSLVFELE